jgi:hypothetical protein
MKPINKISGSISNFKKKEAKKTAIKSNFLLTINLNQKYNDDDKYLENDAILFDKTINDILNDISQYIKLPSQDVWTTEYIKSVESDYVIELGTQKNRLHCHILFKFEHFTKIQLDYDKIKTKILKDTGLNNVYMYNRLVRATSNQNIIDYLTKFT